MKFNVSHLDQIANSIKPFPLRAFNYSKQPLQCKILNYWCYTVVATSNNIKYITFIEAKFKVKPQNKLNLSTTKFRLIIPK